MTLIWRSNCLTSTSRTRELCHRQESISAWQKISLSLIVIREAEFQIELTCFLYCCKALLFSLYLLNKFCLDRVLFGGELGKNFVIRFKVNHDALCKIPLAQGFFHSLLRDFGETCTCSMLGHATARVFTLNA